GFTYDWGREINTTDPQYYKWTQWIFLQLFKKGLAYESFEPINWCPSCQTGLANEDLEGGLCERCGSVVEKRPMRQWVLKITDYAEKLLDGLEGLPWPKSIKESQKNWIGKSEGAEILFPLIIQNQDTTKKKFVLLHGFQGSSSDNHWLGDELRKLGYEVVIPVLPDPSHPNEESWVDAVLNATTYDENTILFGFSLGAVAALKAVEKMKEKIGGLVLAGGFVDPQFLDHPRIFENTFSWSFDAQAIKNKLGFMHFLHDTTDTAVSLEQAARLSKLFDVKITYVQASEPHFCGEKEFSILNYLVPSINVFTTRPDTLFGATYMVLSPEHPWVQLAIDGQHEVLENKEEVREYVTQAAKKTEIDRTAEGKEKTGVALQGVMAINPATGEKIPIWVADYVLAHYGTGAIMGVPAHDERDKQFAETYHLPIVSVVEDDEILVNSGDFTGMKISEAKEKITEKFGTKKTTYKLRDWVFSRQRYWGEPIPIIHCQKCGVVPVPEKDLPVLLPEVEHYEPTGTGESPLAAIPDFVHTTCPNCAGPAKRETNTMPQWAGSSWYYLRFIDSENNKKFVDPEKEKAWMNVDLYVGGAEHATRHLIYARFWHIVLHEMGHVSTREPFERLEHVGLILAEDGRKMSKRWGNVINPDDIVATFGADTLRIYEMFMGPFNQAVSWSTASISGPKRFIERVWKIRGRVQEGDDTVEIISTLHRTIQRVTEDTQNFRFNTAIAAMMELVNLFEKEKTVSKKTFETLLLLLAPYAPHVCEELWEQLGNTGMISRHSWPVYDATLALQKTVSIAIQVNGKVRGELTIAPNASQEEVEALAKDLENIAKHITGKEILKVIYVPGRLLNFVCA
ncbi:MAG TPA: leucine--tRNA ligase, partial [Candidatus Andersenbacteria bacterium]|nr:leucine--tRNA ligase [Candidatus Andersenbacteria bacterium]